MISGAKKYTLRLANAPRAAAIVARRNVPLRSLSLASPRKRAISGNAARDRTEENPRAPNTTEYAAQYTPASAGPLMYATRGVSILLYVNVINPKSAIGHPSAYNRGSLGCETGTRASPAVALDIEMVMSDQIASAMKKHQAAARIDLADATIVTTRMKWTASLATAAPAMIGILPCPNSSQSARNAYASAARASGTSRITGAPDARTTVVPIPVATTAPRKRSFVMRLNSAPAAEGSAATVRLPMVPIPESANTQQNNRNVMAV